MCENPKSPASDVTTQHSLQLQPSKSTSVSFPSAKPYSRAILRSVVGRHAKLLLVQLLPVRARRRPGAAPAALALLTLAPEQEADADERDGDDGHGDGHGLDGRALVVGGRLLLLLLLLLLRDGGGGRGGLRGGSVGRRGRRHERRGRRVGDQADGVGQ